VSHKTTVNNPVLPGFHPDPSILRVGEDYYIANSTFEWYPGVTIHQSKDLVNWEIAARPLDRLSLLNMKGNPKSGGIWAPCLSYSNGTFYLIYTDVKTWYNEPFKDSHNYLTTAENISGPWSEPVYLNSSGFDASLFHDEDGRKWYLNMEWDHRNAVGTDQFTGILLQEFNDEDKTLVGPIVKIFEGSGLGLVEGPHLYKRGDYYYLLTAEGGTSYEHANSICRSKSLFGPYELHPHNPLVTSWQTDGLIQKAGHGSLVETSNGHWYFAFLCGRPMPGTKSCILGRETAIQEIMWENDWPILKNGTNHPDASFDVYEDVKIIPRGPVHYTFHNEDFLKDFQTLRLPYENSRFSIDDKKGFLRIRGKESIVSTHEQAILCRRQQDFRFEAATHVALEAKHFQKMAGLLYRYDETNQYYLALAYDERIASYGLTLMAFDRGKHHYVTEQTVSIPSHEVHLKVVGQETNAQFYYSLDGVLWHAIGAPVDTTILTDEYTEPMGFTGAFIGMGCQDLANQSAKAYFSYFTYTPLL
jgi:xylan 1,4-beta-xylosidase